MVRKHQAARSRLKTGREGDGRSQPKEAEGQAQAQDCEGCRTRVRAALPPHLASSAARQPGAETGTLGSDAHVSSPHLPPRPQSVATHQQRQRDGHEHRTACHTGQAYEVQGPPASSFHHKQLWAERMSVQPAWCPSEHTPSSRRVAPSAGKATWHCRDGCLLPGAQLGDYIGSEGMRAGPREPDS